VPLVGVLVVGGFALAPLVDACPEILELPFVFSPVGGLTLAALTHGAPVLFMLGFVVCAFPGAWFAGAG